MTTSHPATPSMGQNLTAPSTYGTAFQTLDLFKQADGWRGLNFDGGTFNETVEVDPGSFDAAGWPTRMPDGDLAGDVWLTRVAFSDELPVGTYVVRWAGEGTVTTAGAVVEQTDNRIVFEVAPGTGGVGLNGQPRQQIQLNIEATDPDGTGDYVRDVQVMRLEDEPLVDAGQVWRETYLDQIGPFRVVRTMDMQGTNFSDTVEWDAAFETGAPAFWDGRVPLAEIVGLANEINADLWFNIPHAASDDYVREAAAFIRDTLDPELKVRVEYTNEHWTEGFDQKPWLKAQGEALFGAGAPFAIEQYYALRASETIGLFKETFGDDARVDGVITHSAGFAFFDAARTALFEAPELVARGIAPPGESDAFDIVAVDTYYDGGVTFGGGEEVAREWFATLPEAEAADRVFAAMNTGAGLDDPFSFEDVATAYATYRDMADANGWALESYEGGSFHIGEDFEQSPYVDFLMSLNRDPRMAAFQERIYDTWVEAGGGLIAHFADSGYDGYFGN